MLETQAVTDWILRREVGLVQQPTEVDEVLLQLGRPKGSLGVSRLNGKEDNIRRFLEQGVSKTAIAKLTGGSRTTLYSFMRTRGLKPSP